MTAYYAARSSATLDAVCGALQQVLGRSEFCYSRDERWRGQLGDPEWEYAWSIEQPPRLLITRGEGRRGHPLAAQIPAIPQDSILQIVSTGEFPLDEALPDLTRVLGADVVRYAETNDVWTVAEEFDQPIRHVNQTGGNFFAMFTLRLAPSLDTPGVHFGSEKCEGEAAYYVPAVEGGVQDFAFDWLRVGKPLGRMSVTVKELIYHEIDSRMSAYHRAARMAMTAAMERYGLCL
jgi:hypothetical protein